MSPSIGTTLNKGKDILLMIGAGKHQISSIQTAVHMGFYTVAIDRDPRSEGFMYSHDQIVNNAYDYDGIYRLYMNSRRQALLTFY